MSGAWRFGPELDWQMYAACRPRAGAEVRIQRALGNRFFPDHAPSVDVVRSCKTCPVREQCLQWALENNEEGYWAGTSTVQRQKMKEHAS